MPARVPPPSPHAVVDALADRAAVADGAMGTVPRAVDLALDDCAGHAGRTRDAWVPVRWRGAA